MAGPLVQELLIDRTLLNLYQTGKVVILLFFINALRVPLFHDFGVPVWFGYCDSFAPLCQRTSAKSSTGSRITSLASLCILAGFVTGPRGRGVVTSVVLK
jgi:hypothetical protein